MNEINREKLLNALQAHLQANLPDSLDYIAAQWRATHIDLSIPRTWAMGYRRELLDMAQTAYPMICLILGDTTPMPPQSYQGHGIQWAITRLAVTWTVAHHDPDDCYRYKERYGQAIVHCLWESRELAGHQRVDVFPAMPRLWELDIIELPAAGDADLRGAKAYISSGQIVSEWRN